MLKVTKITIEIERVMQISIEDEYSYSLAIII